MDGIKIEVTGNIARVIERPARITAGMVGLPVEFSFDDQWDGLSKTAAFRAGNVEKISENLGTESTVPWEVLENPNAWLSIGVYGVNDDGTVAIPTIWANVCVICEGVNPDGDASTAPTLPVWQRLWNAVGNLLGLTTNAKDNLVEAINEVHNIALAGGIETDTTLTAEGKAAEARATGDEFARVWDNMQAIDEGHVGTDDVIDVEHGGTGATTADVARKNLGAYGRMRLLTDEDDCNNIKDDGVYWYVTARVPKNAPFSNAAIIEVYGADSKTSQKIQRATRYGAGGYSAIRALYDDSWSEWYQYALTTNGVIPVSMGGTGGTSVATAQAALHVNQDYLFSQLDSAGNKSLYGIDAYPTSPGVFRVTTNSTAFGVPGNYGCLVIFNGGGYYMHLYVNSDGFWTARTDGLKAPTWKKMAVAT